MTRRTLLTILALGAATWWAAAANPPAASSTSPNRAAIRFHGSSTLHDFTGTVGTQPISFGRTGDRWSAQGAVNVPEMSTAHAKRDQEMQAMFGAASFPTITASVSNAPVPVTGSTNVLMQLRIRDKELPVQVQISDWRDTGSNLQFRATASVSLKQFGLKPPSVLGIIRVGDTVRLEADVQIGALNP
jgi:polyisoprenoid-binding protein YceI